MTEDLLTQILCADIALLNGEVITMDSSNPNAEAVAAKDGRVILVGKNKEIERVIGEGTFKLELNGKTVLPGFIDTHNHLSLAAADFIALDCSPRVVKSISEITQKLLTEKERFKNIWIRGVNYDDARLEEKRHPTRWDIDKVIDDHPVILVHRGYHIAVINTIGMELLGIDDKVKPPTGGEFGRDPETGRLNGILYENAWFKLWERDDSPLNIEEEDFIKGVKKVSEKYVSSGITSINDAWVSPSNFHALQGALERGELPIRVNLHFINTSLKDIERLGIKQSFGNEWLKIVSIKLILDGSVSGLTAALYEPYKDSTKGTGILLMSREELEDLITRIHNYGFQVSVHANGDKAIDMVLDSFEGLGEQTLEGRRHRIEHCSLLNPTRIKRIKELGLIPVLFAAYPYYHGDKIKPAFGDERVKWLMACRSLIDSGVRIAGHSDYPASPYNPLLGIHSIVNRRTEKGLPFSPEQAISVQEALRMYTIDAAYASFDEEVKGSIESGKYADFTVLEENPFKVPKDRIKDIKVIMTIVNGNVVYNRK